MKITSKWRLPRNEDYLKNEDNLANEDNLKNEDDLKYEDDLKNIIWPPHLREYYMKFFDDLPPQQPPGNWY